MIIRQVLNFPMRCLATFLLLLIISSCATQSNIRHAASQGERVADAKQRIERFATSSTTNVLMPYVKLVNEINKLEESAACDAENLAKYRQMYQLNSSSLLALTLMIACESLTQSMQLEYSQLFQALMIAMVSDKNGATISQAVPMREASEAELILTAAGYQVLDHELLIHDERFLFRFHAVDEDSGEFEYHYYTNFDYVRRIFSSVAAMLTDKDITQIMLKEFTEDGEQLANNYLSTQLYLKQDYAALVKHFANHSNLTPISQLNLAKAYFKLSQYDLLETMIDQLVDQADLGDINASIFIAEIILELSERNVSDKQLKSAELDSLLLEIDERTQPGQAAFLLAKSYHHQKNSEQFKFWSERALSQNQLVFNAQIDRLKVE